MGIYKIGLDKDVYKRQAADMANALYQMAQELLEKEHILLNIGVVGYGPVSYTHLRIYIMESGAEHRRQVERLGLVV